MNTPDDVRIVRGKRFFSEGATKGQFTSTDNLVSIDCIGRWQEGHTEFRLRTDHIDTVFIAIRSFEARNTGENFWLISWRLIKTSTPTRNLDNFVAFIYPSREVERFAVQTIADLLWATDGLSLAGNFEVKNVFLAGVIADKLAWGRYGLH